jgi:hypothetical protein
VASAASCATCLISVTIWGGGVVPGGGKALVVSFLIVLGTSALVLYAVEQKGSLHVEFPDPLQLTSLAITAAALVVTGVGVFVALLAFIGYREILTKGREHGEGGSGARSSGDGRAAGRPLRCGLSG